MQFFQAHILKYKFFMQPDLYLWRSEGLIRDSLLLSSLPSFLPHFLTKGMVSLVVDVVLSVDPRAGNWYAVNERI